MVNLLLWSRENEIIFHTNTQYKMPTSHIIQNWAQNVDGGWIVQQLSD